jgi:flavin-dependent dehydrogenase
MVATGCQPIDTYAFDRGPITLTGHPGTTDEPVSYGPRRTVLDKILVDAASRSAVEVREAFTVEEVVFDNGAVTGIRGHGKGGESVTENARVVIGADGRHSLVARDVKPERYNEKPPLLAGYYSYWSGVPMNGRFEAYDRGNRSYAAWPTNEDMTLIVGGWPVKEFEENKKDIEGNFMKMIDLVPAFADRVRGGKREDRFYGAFVPNYFRKPYGPGWALVGDAGYNRDFITAQGISDAFRDAELCANAVDESLSGGRSFDDTMSEYQSTRDSQVAAIYEFTCDFAKLEPPPPERQQLMAAVYGNQEAMDGFARVFSGVTSPAEFFSEENVGRIFAAAQARQSA